MGAGAEGRPGSTTRSIAPSRGSSQEGRSQRRSPTRSGLWKSCQRSAQSSGTSVETDLDQAVAGRRLDLAQLRQLALAAVDRVLDVAGPALLLDPVRAPARSARRGPARPARAQQRTARRINRRLGARGRRGPRRRCGSEVPASSVSSSFSASSRCSSVRLVGTMTWMTITQVAGRAAAEPGRPWPRSANCVPGLDAGRQLDLALALVAGDLHRGPQHRLDGGDLDRVDQVLAAHRPAPHLEAEAAAEERLEDVLDRAEARRPAAKPPERRPSWP